MSLMRVIKEIAYGIDTWNAITHGARPAPSPEQPAQHPAPRDAQHRPGPARDGGTTLGA